MNIVKTVNRLTQRDTFYAIFDRILAPIHVSVVSTVFDQYLVSQRGVTVDVSEINLRSLVKFRLRQGRLLYEDTESHFITEYIKRDYNIVDLGAGIGFSSILATKQTNSETKTIAVEANPELERIIQKNAELNNSDISVVSAAYNPNADTTEFHISHSDYRDSTEYEIYNKKVEVNSVSLQDIFKKHDLETASLIVDIEGGETELIENELEYLKDRCNMLIIEFHPHITGDMNSMINKLNSHSFKMIDSCGDVYVFFNSQFNH